MNILADDICIESWLVPEHERLQILPKHFGRYLTVVETMIYDWTRRLVPAYTGGYWHFYELSNGGFYMPPDLGKSRLIVPTNDFEGELSPDAIGITVCLFTFSHGSFQFPGETFVNHYAWLREYSYFHAEGGLISKAVD